MAVYELLPWHLACVEDTGKTITFNEPSSFTFSYLSKSIDLSGGGGGLKGIINAKQNNTQEDSRHSQLAWGIQQVLSKCPQQQSRVYNIKRIERTKCPT